MSAPPKGQDDAWLKEASKKSAGALQMELDEAKEWIMKLTNEVDQLRQIKKKQIDNFFKKLFIPDLGDWYERWKENTNAVAHAKKVCRSVVARLQNAQLFEFFRTWKEFAENAYMESIAKEMKGLQAKIREQELDLKKAKRDYDKLKREMKKVTDERNQAEIERQNALKTLAKEQLMGAGGPGPGGPTGGPPKNIVRRTSRELGNIQATLQKLVMSDIVVQSRRDQEKPEGNAPEGRVSLVFTDIQNSTWLWDRFGETMYQALERHNVLCRDLLNKFNGYEVKTEGDAFMLAFHDALDAAKWCLGVQVGLMHIDWPEPILEVKDGQIQKTSDGNLIYRGLRVRMGIHTGSPRVKPDHITRRADYFGPMVNASARVSGSSNGGQILISTDTWEDIKDRMDELDNPLKFDHGSFKYKGISKPIEVMEIKPAILANRPSPSPKAADDKEAPRGTVTLVFTEILDFADRYEENPEIMRNALSLHEQAISRLIKRSKSYMVRMTSGSVIVAFQDAIDAVKWCMEAHILLVEQPWTQDLLKVESMKVEHNIDGDIIYSGLRICTACVTGEPDCVENMINNRLHYVGVDVSIGTLLARIGNPGQTIMCGRTYEGIESDIGKEELFSCTAKSLGSHVVHKQPLDIYEVVPSRLQGRVFESLRPVSRLEEHVAMLEAENSELLNNLATMQIRLREAITQLNSVNSHLQEQKHAENNESEGQSIQQSSPNRRMSVMTETPMLKMNRTGSVAVDTPPSKQMSISVERQDTGPTSRERVGSPEKGRKTSMITLKQADKRARTPHSVPGGYQAVEVDGVITSGAPPVVCPDCQSQSFVALASSKHLYKLADTIGNLVKKMSQRRELDPDVRAEFVDILSETQRKLKDLAQKHDNSRSSLLQNAGAQAYYMLPLTKADVTPLSLSLKSAAGRNTSLVVQSSSPDHAFNKKVSNRVKGRAAGDDDNNEGYISHLNSRVNSRQNSRANSPRASMGGVEVPVDSERRLSRSAEPNMRNGPVKKQLASLTQDELDAKLQPMRKSPSPIGLSESASFEHRVEKAHKQRRSSRTAPHMPRGQGTMKAQPTRRLADISKDRQTAAARGGQ